MFYMQHETNSADRLEINPEYDYRKEGKLVEEQHRTMDGSMFQYTWGSYCTRKFSLKWVDSNAMSIINSWWQSKAILHFYEIDNPAEVSTVILINKGCPIGKFMKPYSDKFEGTIEMSTF